ncbi:hypothetical protein HMPREF3159_15935 [Brachybacterium sp. HMSC06H03]|uniref:lipopolysaccharide biosynthesis protein n=1 Tax=Brachybacterium sp. HMSC06H03 TaxID=1581127 RepID=UPI0008A39387|nr:hypothetical protein [Brachybacterium sp. HMSC06H03]OFT44128.1 hypothetical protein HMPREF3159_15935 [Brachybacterium sp. HMSC06H03]
MPETRTAPAEAPPARSPGLFARAGSFLLILGGTIGSGISHWFIVWLIAATYGAAGLGEYSVVLAGATPLFIFLGLGLRNVYVSLAGSPRWGTFLRWRVGGLALAFALLAVYCLVAAPFWGIFLGMAVMKVADGLSELALARLQRQGRFTALGALTSVGAVATVAAISVAASLSAPIGVLLACVGGVSLVLGLVALVLSRPSRSVLEAEEEVGVRRLLAAALPITASTGLMSLVASIPVWFLGAHTSAPEVGRFTAAAYLIVAANLLGASAQTILITTYRRHLAEEGAASLLRSMGRHTLLLGAVAGPVVVAVVLLGDPFLRLVYGDAFGASPLELLAFGLTAALCILGYLNSTVLLVLNWYRSQLLTTIATLVGAALPLALATLIGTTQWVLVGILSMTGAYLVRFVTARLLLTARRVVSDVPH